MSSFPDDKCIITENFEKEKQKISTKNDLPVKKKNWACHGQMNLL